MRFNLILAALLFLGSCQNCMVKKNHTVLEESFIKALDFTKTLPHSGTLVQQADGFAYIKLDDGYIHELFALLDLKPEYKKPPYFRRKNAPGAHISVIYENEKVSLSNVGQIFNFEPKEIKVVKTHKAEFIILEVNAPKLEQLRTSHGLSPKLQGHEFHITIAKKEISNK